MALMGLYVRGEIAARPTAELLGRPFFPLETIAAPKLGRHPSHDYDLDAIVVLAGAGQLHVLGFLGVHALAGACQ